MQYFYITNLSGDVIAITDTDGNLIAEYTYDEWGKLLAITPAEEDNAEQLTIAETNPLRYRGYYYDNETGLYYLQSRYYNPEIGRFISADGFEYIDTSNRLSANAYAYCWNCPVAFSDTEGTTPELAFDMDSLIAFFQNAGKYIKEKLQENFTNLQSKFNAFVEKAKFWITHPDVIINNMLSQLLGREVKLKFPLLNAIRDSAENAKQEQQESSQNEEYGIATYAYDYTVSEDEKTDNWLEAALKGLVLAIPMDFICSIFEGIVMLFNPLFDFNDWYDGLSDNGKFQFGDILITAVTAFFTLVKDLSDETIDKIADLISDWAVGDIAEEIFGKATSSFLGIFDVFDSIDDNFNGMYSIEYSFIATFVDIAIFFIGLVFPGIAIGADLIDEYINNSIYNYNTGKFWG